MRSEKCALGYVGFIDQLACFSSENLSPTDEIPNPRSIPLGTYGRNHRSTLMCSCSLWLMTLLVSPAPPPNSSSDLPLQPPASLLSGLIFSILSCPPLCHSHLYLTLSSASSSLLIEMHPNMT